MSNTETPNPGDRVRVTYEGEFVSFDGDGEPILLVQRDGANGRIFAPADATIEVLAAPIPDEPTGLGAVVQVDGRLATRVDLDHGASEPWRRTDRYWCYWSELVRGAKSVKILSPGVEVPPQ